MNECVTTSKELVIPSTGIISHGNFCHLHCHGGSSLLDGYGTPEQQIDVLKELGHTAMALTDHGSVWGSIDFDQKMRKAGLKPISGVEFYLVEDMAKKYKGSKDEESAQSEFGDQRAHITVLANSEAGYRSLMRLVRLSYEEGYYYKPRIDMDCLVRNQEGLTVLSGCVGGMFARQIIAGMDDMAFKWLRWASQRIESFYVELIPCPDLPFAVTAIQKLDAMALELGLPTIITNDSHFPRPEDHRYEDTMVCIGINKTMSEERKLRLAEYHYICDRETLKKRSIECLPHTSEERIDTALDVSGEIASRIDYELPVARGPLYSLDPSTTPMQELRRLVAEGRARRIRQGKVPLDNIAEYDARQELEFSIIETNAFANYFLIVADMVRFVFDSGEYCAARGSCGGSLCCWYLRISNVDPLKYDIPLARFIDVTRTDVPDIDIDFPKAVRHSVFEYLTSKYGIENCGQVAAISYYRASQSIRDVGKVHGVPGEIVNYLAKMVPGRMAADEAVKTTNVLHRYFEENTIAKAIVEKYPCFQIAAELEGQMRHSTVHAAGYVVNDGPISEICGYIHKPGDLPIIAVTKDLAQALGLIKIDVLSLDTLDVISQCVKAIGKDVEWLESLSDDDPAVYDMLSKGINTGVFQLQGHSCGPLMKRLKPQDIHDIVALSVLCRPGPLQSGATDEYIERKYGRMEMPDYHPTIMTIVEKTRGTVIYQDQVMAVASEVGGFDPVKTNKVRKYITSTSYGAEDIDKEFFADYLLGADDRGIPIDQAAHVWEQCKKAGNYSFNKAHAYAYGMVGYLTAYFKVHHPAVFTAVSASRDDKDGKRVRLFSDFKNVGGNLKVLDYNESIESFRAVDDKTLVGGFMDITGIGPVIANQLMEGQPYDSWDHFYQECKPSIRGKLMSVGFHKNKMNLGQLALIAPWYIDTTQTDLERVFCETYGVEDVGMIEERLEDGQGNREVKCVGKIVSIEFKNAIHAAKKYGGKMPADGEPYIAANVTIVDGTGTIALYYNRFKWAEILEHSNPLQGVRRDGVGNGVYVHGEISRDYNRVWGDHMVVLSTLTHDTVYNTTTGLLESADPDDIIVVAQPKKPRKKKEAA